MNSRLKNVNNLLTTFSESSASKASKTFGTNSAGSLSKAKFSQVSAVLVLLLVEVLGPDLPKREEVSFDFLAGTVGAITLPSLFLSRSTKTKLRI